MDNGQDNHQLDLLLPPSVTRPLWRSLLGNLKDRLFPEKLPPLELESRPEDVGELVSDQMGHMWWTSLLRNLADRVAPERLPPLQLTSAPVDADLKSGSMQLARWSSLITLPKVPVEERKYFTAAPPRQHVT